MVECTLSIKLKNGREREFQQELDGFGSNPGLIRRLSMTHGCLGYRVRSDNTQKYQFIIESEWRSSEEMEEHFRGNNFTILLGAIKVLCQTCDVRITDGTRSAGMEAIEEARYQ